MRVQSITSHDNALLKQIRALHKRSFREKFGQYLIEGEKLVQEAFLKNVGIDAVVVSESFFAALRHTDFNIKDLYVVSDKLFDELSTTENPTGILAQARIAEENSESFFDKNTGDKNPLIVIADRIQDPGNLGTLVRTSLAANATGVIAIKGTVDLYNAKVQRASMGASFVLPYLSDQEPDHVIDLCRKHGLTILSLQMQSHKTIWQTDLTKPFAFIVGNEGQGVSQCFAGIVDDEIMIPMNSQSESLNASAAATVVLFEAMRQRMA